MNIGGYHFDDISGIIPLMSRLRPRTDGLVLHHTVGQTQFPDANMNGSSQDEELAHIKAIDTYHVSQSYGGFGYNAIVFMSGRVWVVGKCADWRAHTRGENDHLAGLAMAGDFSVWKPPLGVILGAAQWVHAMFREYGYMPVYGHRYFGGTACPGDGGMCGKDDVLEAVQALEAGRQEELAGRVRLAIAQALAPSAQRADLERLAAQIAWLTGDRLCG